MAVTHSKFFLTYTPHILALLRKGNNKVNKNRYKPINRRHMTHCGVVHMIS